MSLAPAVRAVLARSKPLALQPSANLLCQQPQPPSSRRFYSAPSDDSASSMTPAESAIASTLSSHDTLRPTSSVLVRDVSGGCGSMYAIDVASSRFRGLSLLAQQRLVNRALGDQVKQWHGVQIRTSIPAEEQ